MSEPVRIFMIQNRKIKSEKVETSIIGVPIAEFPVPEQNKVQKIRNDLGISSDEQVDIPMMEQGVYSEGLVVIGDDVWLGAGAMVLDGLRLARDVLSVQGQ